MASPRSPTAKLQPDREDSLFTYLPPSWAHKEWEQYYNYPSLSQAPAPRHGMGESYFGAQSSPALELKRQRHPAHENTPQVAQLESPRSRGSDTGGSQTPTPPAPAGHPADRRARTDTITPSSLGTIDSVTSSGGQTPPIPSILSSLSNERSGYSKLTPGVSSPIGASFMFPQQVSLPGESPLRYSRQQSPGSRTTSSFSDQESSVIPASPSVRYSVDSGTLFGDVGPRSSPRPSGQMNGNEWPLKVARRPPRPASKGGRQETLSRTSSVSQEKSGNLQMKPGQPYPGQGNVWPRIRIPLPGLTSPRDDLNASFVGSLSPLSEESSCTSPESSPPVPFFFPPQPRSASRSNREKVPISLPPSNDISNYTPFSPGSPSPIVPSFLIPQETTLTVAGINAGQRPVRKLNYDGFPSPDKSPPTPSPSPNSQVKRLNWDADVTTFPRRRIPVGSFSELDSTLNSSGSTSQWSTGDAGTSLSPPTPSRSPNSQVKRLNWDADVTTFPRRRIPVGSFSELDSTLNSSGSTSQWSTGDAGTSLYSRRQGSRQPSCCSSAADSPVPQPVYRIRSSTPKISTVTYGLKSVSPISKDQDETQRFYEKGSPSLYFNSQSSFGTFSDSSSYTGNEAYLRQDTSSTFDSSTPGTGESQRRHSVSSRLDSPPRDVSRGSTRSRHASLPDIDTSPGDYRRKRVMPDIDYARLMQPMPRRPPRGTIDSVESLKCCTFNKFIKEKAVAVVMFYNSAKSKPEELENWTKHSLKIPRNTNPAFATVNCAVESQLCANEGIRSHPFYKLYVDGFLVNAVKDFGLLNYA